MMMVLLLLLEAVRQTDSSISNERAKHTIKSPSVQREEEEKSSSRDTQLCIATSCWAGLGPDMAGLCCTRATSTFDNEVTGNQRQQEQQHHQEKNWQTWQNFQRTKKWNKTWRNFKIGYFPATHHQSPLHTDVVSVLLLQLLQLLELNKTHSLASCRRVPCFSSRRVARGRFVTVSQQSRSTEIPWHILLVPIISI